MMDPAAPPWAEKSLITFQKFFAGEGMLNFGTRDPSSGQLDRAALVGAILRP